MTTPAGLSAVADALQPRRAAVLDDWRQRAIADESLDETSEWSRRQLDDHFPDIFDSFLRRLRETPDSQKLVDDEHDQAFKHAQTRWLQGYSLRAVVREWGHFNGAMVDAIGALHGAVDAEPLRRAQHVWSNVLNDQLTDGAIEYHRLIQSEARTRAEESLRTLQLLREMEDIRARALSETAESLRGDLSVLMTSNSAMQGLDPGDALHHELRSMSQSGLAGLDRALSDMTLLAQLEGRLVRNDTGTFDAGPGLLLLAEGMAHNAAKRHIRLDWQGPESLVVQGDERNTRLLGRYLVM